MPLTATEVKAAQPKEKDYKLYDEKGLLLLVRTTGAKYWRLKYRYSGKEKLLALGVYPEVTLAQARKARDNARALLHAGGDPGETKQAQKKAKAGAAANSFEVVAREWMSKRGSKSESGDKRLVRLLERDLFPFIGRRPIAEITPPELLDVLRKIEARGALETAHRAKQYAGQVFRYAIATGRATYDPSEGLKGALTTPQQRHHAAITDPKGVGLLLASIYAYRGTPIVAAALKLSPLLFCRPGELRHLEWHEVNWEQEQIEIPADKMKAGEPHIMPLSRQALAILRELQQIRRGNYVFPSAKGATRPLSENGVRTALRTMGYDNDTMTPHGFRAMARTLLDEVLGYRIEWIEQQLAHAVKDVHGRAYNRTKHLPQRRKMMQHWADYLDQLGAQALAGNVITADFGGGQA